MSNPDGPSGRVFRDYYVGYQEFKDLENDVRQVKLLVYAHQESIDALIASLGKIAKLTTLLLEKTKILMNESKGSS